MGTSGIRPARADDVPVVLSLVRELAEYEKSLEAVHATEDSLRSALFCEAPAAFCHVAELDGQVVGLALWFLNFSTWTGTHGIYLEDLYVQPAARGAGLGKRLLLTLAQIAAERGYARVEWSVLDWNTTAIDFYRSLGAVAMDEWTVMRLTGSALAAAGQQVVQA